MACEFYFNKAFKKLLVVYLKFQLSGHLVF